MPRLISAYHHLSAFSTLHDDIHHSSTLLTSHSYRQLGLDLSPGGFRYYHLELLKQVSRDRAVPTALKSGLETALTRSQDAFSRAEGQIGKIKSDTKTGKLKYTFCGERKLVRRYTEFHQRLDELDKLCAQLNNIQARPPINFLRGDLFKLVHETTEVRPGDTLLLSDIYIARGNYHSDDRRVSGLFVLEKKYRENDIKFLCNKVTELSQSEGILKCLGYRQPPYNEEEPPYRPFFQLVMELPDLPRKSLSYAISCDTILPLGQRLQYGKQITTIVRNVHEMNLVHKSIRPRAILLLETIGSERNTTQLYLQDWTYVRENTDATSLVGVDKYWDRQIYQHPERQGRPGRYIEEDFKAKHDLYSLGVTMLEIFLWRPLVERVDKTNMKSPLRISQLFEDKAISLGEENGGVPVTYRGDTEKLTSDPLVIQNVLVDIATHELAAIHPRISEIVLECLKFENACTARVILEELSGIEVEN
jgi:serine/threonine protein kinase